MTVIGVYVTSRYKNYEEFKAVMDEALKKYIPTGKPNALCTGSSKSNNAGNGLVRRYAFEMGIPCRVFETQWANHIPTKPGKKNTAGVRANAMIVRNSNACIMLYTPTSVAKWDFMSGGCYNFRKMCGKLRRELIPIKVDIYKPLEKPSKDVEEEPPSRTSGDVVGDIGAGRRASEIGGGGASPRIHGGGGGGPVGGGGAPRVSAAPDAAPAADEPVDAVASNIAPNNMGMPSAAGTITDLPVDVTGDGAPDINVPAMDTNGDGMPDAVLNPVDTDGDGNVDNVEIAPISQPNPATPQPQQMQPQPQQMQPQPQQAAATQDAVSADEEKSAAGQTS